MKIISIWKTNDLVCNFYLHAFNINIIIYKVENCVFIILKHSKFTYSNSN